MNLSVVIITVNEEANISRTLASVKPLVADGKGEIIVVDSGSTDRTVEIAKSYGAKVFVEEWKGYAAQKNSAIDKAAGDWILSLDADEEVEPALAEEINDIFPANPPTREDLLAGAKIPGPGMTPKDARKAIKVARASEMLSGGAPHGVMVAVTGYWVPRKNEFLGRW